LISFSRQVKEEVVFNDFDDCCKKALLLALIKINGTLSLTSNGMAISLRTENAKIASKAHKILKDLYQPSIEFLVSKKMKLRKNNVYIVRINKAREILEDLHILTSDIPDAKVLEKECCARAYLAGAFLAGGSVNNPSTSNYHLDIIHHVKMLNWRLLSLSLLIVFISMRKILKEEQNMLFISNQLKRLPISCGL